MLKEDGRPKLARLYNKIRQSYNALCIPYNWGYSHTHIYYVITVDVKANAPVNPYMSSACLFSYTLTQQSIRNISTLHTHQQHAAVSPVWCSLSGTSVLTERLVP